MLIENYLAMPFANRPGFGLPGHLGQAALNGPARDERGLTAEVAWSRAWPLHFDWQCWPDRCRDLPSRRGKNRVWVAKTTSGS
jgi:hypothetical protein